MSTTDFFVIFRSLGSAIALVLVPAWLACGRRLRHRDPNRFSHLRTVRPDGDHEPVTLYTLTNKNGVSVSIMDYGATIVKILAPDRNGKLGDVVLGFDHFSPYIHLKTYFGATIGRYANRIAKGQFTMGKTVYQLARNNGPNSLHGGLRGFDKRMWKCGAGRVRHPGAALQPPQPGWRGRLSRQPFCQRHLFAQ